MHPVDVQEEVYSAGGRRIYRDIKNIKSPNTPMRSQMKKPGKFQRHQQPCGSTLQCTIQCRNISSTARRKTKQEEAWDIHAHYHAKPASRLGSVRGLEMLPLAYSSSARHQSKFKGRHPHISFSIEPKMASIP